MPANVTTKSMGRFIDRWVYIAIATPVILFLASLIAGSFVKSLGTTNIQVAPGQTVKLNPIDLKARAVGALRIDVEAIIPDNRWLTYDVQVQDQSGNLLAMGRKQAWQESGTWSEDGEFGNWSEKDLRAGLDVLAQQSEPVVFAISVSDYTTTTRQSLSEPVNFLITLKNGVIDTRHLWSGFWGSLFLAGIAIFAVRTVGTRVIDHTQPDSDLNARAILGGPRSLLQLTITVRADETDSGSVNAELMVKDGMGQQVYTPVLPVKLTPIRDEYEPLDDVIGQARCYLLLNRRTSYGFYVKVTPEQPVNSTRLTIKEGVKTLRSVPFVEIDA